MGVTIMKLINRVNIVLALTLYAKYNGANWFLFGARRSDRGVEKTDLFLMPITLLPALAPLCDVRVSSRTGDLAVRFHMSKPALLYGDMGLEPVATFTGKVTGVELEQALCDVLGGRRDEDPNRSWWTGADVYLNDGRRVQCKGVDGAIELCQIEDQAQAHGESAVLRN